MFRTGLIVKYGIVRMINPCQLVQTSVKRCATSASPTFMASDSKVDKNSSSEPAWVKTPLERQIYTALDAQSLLSSVENHNFDGKCAINVVNILSRWVVEGKFTVADFKNTNQRTKLEENLLKGEFNVGVPGILQALKGLLVLGFSPNSKVVESLENEILWLMRKMNIGQHFLVISFYFPISKNTVMQEKVLKEIVSNIQRRWVELVEARDFISLFKYGALFSSKFMEKMEDATVEMVESFTQDEQAKIMGVLSATQRRSTPLLRALSYHLNKNSEKLPVRTASDVLFALQRLNLHDQLLMERICNDLMTQLTPEIKSSIIGSIFTSLGQLKYRHEGCLDVLCDWINLNWENIRHQDVVSLVLCIAALDFLPSSWKPLWEKISQILKEETLSSNFSPTIQLDLVWSLAVLNHLEPNICKCVLNDGFINQMLGSSTPNSKGAQLKLNQIWATAVIKQWDLTELKTKLPYPFELSPLESKHLNVNQAVVNALGNFVPPGKYLRVGGQTSLGIEVDAEFIMSDKCVPLPLGSYEHGETLPENAARIAVIVLNYKDVCRGKHLSTGVNGLRERLLIQSGYRVIKIKHTEFDLKENLVKKVQNLEQLIKNAMIS